VIKQGIDEGVISADSPDETATVLTSLMLGYQQLAAGHMIARQAGAVSFEEVRRSIAAFTEGFERILGVPKGSITLIEEPTLHFWFG